MMLNINLDVYNLIIYRTKFITVYHILPQEMDVRQKRGLTGPHSPSISPQSDSNATNKAYAARSYGYSRRGLRGNFVPPIRSKESSGGNVTSRIGGKGEDALDDSTKRWLVN